MANGTLLLVLSHPMKLTLLVLLYVAAVALGAETQTDLVAGVPLGPGPDPSLVASALAALPLRPDARGLNMLWVIFGQAAVDHNMVLTPGSGGASCHPPHPDAAFFDGVPCFPFTSAGSTPVNNIDAPLLRSFFVYGDANRTDALRDGDKMRLDRYEFLPRAGSLGVEGSPAEAQFVAGDVRAGENTFLTVMHTLWTRRHNFWVARGYDFEGARARVEQEVDAVIFDEWLPAGIGPYADCEGVGPVDQVDKTFGVLFRIHSMVNPAVIRKLRPYGIDTLADSFFDPGPLEKAKGDLKTFVLSMYQTPALSDNLAMASDLNRMLFSQQPGPAFSLAVANLRREVDLGLSDFNSVRVAVGLEPYHSYDQFVSEPGALDLLNTYYPRGPSTCPVWLCVRAETPAPGSSIGETGSVWMRNQLCGMRRKPPQPEPAVATFSTILCETTNACGIERDAFRGTGKDHSNVYVIIALGLLLTPAIIVYIL